MNNQLFTPDYSHITGLLKHLNDEELKELLNNEDKLKNIINDLKQVHDIEAEREMLLASNKSISEYNLSKKPVLDLHHKQVEETRKIALDLKNAFLEKKEKIEHSEKALSKETLLALLQAATSEAEEEAEACVEFFLKNELSVEDFLERYLPQRKIAHLRRIKSEKLANLLHSEFSRNVSSPNRQQKLRVPPPPPAPKQELLYPTNTTAQTYVNYGPVRTAPLPPMSTNFLYTQNPVRPAQPFQYVPGNYPGYSMAHPSHPYPAFK